MKLQSSFRRKIGYLVAIVGLLFCLYWLGAPATGSGIEGEGSPGGWLVRYRARPDVGLNQARLGEIDPTGLAVKLSTFGLRGVAANLLWTKATEYKMKKDWTNLAAAVNQIIKLQPNFISVWLFQAWNQSYNISVEFEDVRQRYHWVIRGIQFLKQGERYNSREPRLPWEVGWITTNKIGRSDERRQFRKMFVEDDDFHQLPGGGTRRMIDRDNWLVGREWFIKAENLADRLGVKMKGKGPLIYRSNAPMCLMTYAETLEEEGHFGERARVAWQRALESWLEFGDKDIPTGSGKIIHLNDKEEHDRRIRELAKEIDELQVGSLTGADLREQIKQEKIASLSEEMRQAYEIPWDKRKGEEVLLGDRAEELTQVSEMDVALRITGPNRQLALDKANEALEHRKWSQLIERQRQIINFEYWRLRAQMEQLQVPDEEGNLESITVDARQLIYDANQLFEQQGDLAGAIEKYNQALRKWRRILDMEQFHPMLADPIFGDEMLSVISRYRHILELDDKEFPKQFILQDVLDLHETGA